MSILDTTARPASSQKALSADQHWRHKALATGTIDKRSRITKNQRTGSERRLGRYGRGTIPQRPTIGTRDYQN